MKATIQKEDFNPELFAELLPLAQKCWDESTAIKKHSCAYGGLRDFKVEPSAEIYQRMADQGGLLILTLRDEGLKGYAVGFLYKSWHHKEIQCANADSIYLEPEYRSYAAVMVKRFEDEMASLGVQIIGWPTHPDGPVYTMLERLGYVGDDLIMEKRLKCQV